MHLGVIPDGNRRYARNKGIKEKEAYRRAKEVVEEIGQEIEESERDVDEITFYLLSEENLRRDDEELEDLFELLEEYIEEVSKKYSRNGFVFNWGSTAPEALPQHLQEKLLELEEEHDSGDKQLNLLISYTGKQDILNSAEQVCRGDDEFNQSSLRQNLEIESDIDFVIRTGDNPHRECVSGFPIWNSSYAEFYHIQENFPAISPEDVEEALDHYQKLRRKKGR